MKFFEKTVKLETLTVWDFLRTAANMIFLSPFRLIQEISKKVVYLPNKSLEKMLFLSIFIGVGFTVVSSVLRFSKGAFSLTDGTFPVICMLLGTLALVGVYLWYNSAKDVIYKQMEQELVMRKRTTTEQKGTAKESEESSADVSESTVMKEDAAKQQTTQVESTEDLSLDDLTLDEMLVNDLEQEFVEDTPPSKMQPNKTAIAAASSKAWLQQNDYYTAPANADLVGSTEVKNYQNRLQTKISDLEEYAQNCTKYSEEEVELLQKKLDSMAGTNKFFGGQFAAQFNDQLLIDEEQSLQNAIDDIQEDFELCS